MKKQLYILDGSGYVFRAYYGMPPLTDREWRNVNAVYGFFRMLFKLWQRKPEKFIIAWDAKAKTKRKEQYEEYKANRTKMPDEFHYQMRLIKHLVEAIGISALEMPGYEADDIIGTLAQSEVQHEDVWVTIVSSDKDLKQLVTERVTMFDAMKDMTTTPKSFLLNNGYEAPLIVDYLSLVWDASDNISGVRWIGKKWASTLVQTYGDLDTIYANIDKIKGAIKQKLIDGKESAYHSKGLIKLMDVPEIHDMPIPWSVTFDFAKMQQVLVEEHGFTSLEKLIIGLKKQWQAGEQLGLFG